MAKFITGSQSDNWNDKEEEEKKREELDELGYADAQWRKNSLPPADLFVRNQQKSSVISTDNQREIHIGMVFNGCYRIIGRGGQGRLGQVWKALDIIGERNVALKFVPLGLARYEREMRRVKETFLLVHSLAHQYICPHYALVNDETFGYFLVMKWMPETLCDFCYENTNQNNRVAPAVALRILSNLAEALDYAHSQGVIHRDIKPTNISIIRDANDKFAGACLIDFGLSAIIKKAIFVTKEAHLEILGTPCYMPPEQWLDKTQDATSDQYSLAVVAYEMLNGECPFSNSNIDVLRSSILNDKPQKIHGIPSYMNAALLKALSKKREDRFKNCVDFIDSLSGRVHRRRIKAVAFFLMSVISVLLALMFFIFESMILVIDNSYKVMSDLPSDTSGQVHLDHLGPTADPNAVLRYVENFHAPLINWFPDGIHERPVTNTSEGVVVGDQQVEESTGTASGAGWSYGWDAERSMGVVTLDGYRGGPISSNGVNLTIELAGASHNEITGLDRESIYVKGASLNITGDGTGDLTVKTSSSRAKEVIRTIRVAPGGSMTVSGLTRMTVQATLNCGGILLEKGDFSADQVHDLKIFSSGSDALHVHGGITLSGSPDDTYSFNGGIWHQDHFRLASPNTDPANPNIPVFHLNYNDKPIQATIENFEQLVQAFYTFSTESKKTLLVVSDIVSNNYEHTNAGRTSRLIVPRKCEVTLISTGNWSILRGEESNPEEPLIDVRGHLALGDPNDMGTATLSIDGGADWYFDEDDLAQSESARRMAQEEAQNEQPPAATTDATAATPVAAPAAVSADVPVQPAQRGVTPLFSEVWKSVLYRREGDVGLFKKASSRHSCLSPLISVSGVLNLNDNVVIQNNDNIRELRSMTQIQNISEVLLYAGGVSVEQKGTFKMSGGRIMHCSSAFGAAVNVLGDFHLAGGEIYENLTSNDNARLTSEGAGVRVAYGHFLMTGGEISRNVSLGYSLDYIGNNSAKGAGLHVSQDATAELNGGRITSNVSEWAGGAVYVGGNGSSKLKISKTYISDNCAILGGGIFMNSPLNFQGGDIFGNYVFHLRDTDAIESNDIFLSRMNMSDNSILQLASNPSTDAESCHIFISRVFGIKGGEIIGSCTPIIVTESLNQMTAPICISIGDIQVFTDTTFEYSISYLDSLAMKVLSFEYLNNKTSEKYKAQADRFKLGVFGMDRSDLYELRPYSEPLPHDSLQNEKYSLILKHKK